MAQDKNGREGNSGLPVPSDAHLVKRLDQIEENLNKLVTYEIHERAMVNDELVGRIVRLEATLDNERRVNRALLAVIIVVVVLVQGVAGLLISSQFALMQGKLDMQRQQLSDIFSKLGSLNLLGGAGNADTMKWINDVANKFVNSPNNGIMQESKIINELLDELEGKKKSAVAATAPERPAQK